MLGDPLIPQETAWLLQAFSNKTSALPYCTLRMGAGLRSSLRRDATPGRDASGKGLKKGGLWARLTLQASEGGILWHLGMKTGAEKWDEAPSMESWDWGSIPRLSLRPWPSPVEVTIAKPAGKRMPVVPASHGHGCGSSGMSPVRASTGRHSPGSAIHGCVSLDLPGLSFPSCKERLRRPSLPLTQENPIRRWQQKPSGQDTSL